MQRRSAARLGATGLACAGTVLVLAAPAAAAHLGPGALAGTWKIDVTVVSFSPSNAGDPPDTPGGTSVNPLMPKVGHQGTITVTFTPRCTGRACTLDIAPAPGSAGSFSHGDFSATGFALPGPGQSPKIGPGDALQFPGFGGFGGPCKGFTPPFEYSITATVQNSVSAGGAEHVATLRGSEFLIVLGRDCKQIQHARVDFTATNLTLAALTQPSAAPATSQPPTPVSASHHHAAAATGLPATLNRRSALTAALDTPARVLGSPLRDLANIAIALGVMLFITFPANLFNKTFEENYDDIAAFWRRRLGPVGMAAGRWKETPSDVRRRLGYAATVVIGAVLGMELNPATGADLASLTNFLATMATIVASTMLGFGVSVWFRRRRGIATRAQVHGLPGGLLVAAICVALSRGAHFRPGYLYGVVAGVSFAAALGKRENGQLVALSHVVSFAVAIAAWLIWIPVNHAASHPGSSLALVGIDDVLGALFVGALVGGTIQLIPLSFMPGRALAAWHRGVWSAVFVVTLFTLVAAVLNPGQSNVHPGEASIITAVILLAGFG
ncbi:MAG: hypothetical protein JO222_06160, partial [Frankiales bacterium]|nr:hypothetical protein [Frankiales bacterium]